MKGEFSTWTGAGLSLLLLLMTSWAYDFLWVWVLLTFKCFSFCSLSSTKATFFLCSKWLSFTCYYWILKNAVLCPVFFPAFLVDFSVFLIRFFLILSQISNRGRLGLGQKKELQIEWHSWHQFLKSVGPNSSLLNLLLCWILTFKVALKITVYLGYYKTNQKWNLGWHQVFHVYWQMESCWFLSYKSYLWLL